jgi:8-oxo-dGTP pyrophosphatase MutT (NUDIX family)
LFIPSDRLPPGFLDSIGHTTEPVEPRLAATIVLMRDAATPASIVSSPEARPGKTSGKRVPDPATGTEVFMLRRNRSAGFVPGAWVFAGGRVDAADAAVSLWSGDTVPSNPSPGFWMAAVRELFEETGVLLARDVRGEFAPDASHEVVASWREKLLEDECTLADVLSGLDARIAADRIVHFAHWITPVAEPRRYDTHFFVGAMPEGRAAAADPREMSDATWISPAAALDRFARGSLPMVFPTVRTLEMLSAFDSVRAALDTLRGTTVAPILPRLVRTDGGVRLVVDEGAGEA